MNPYRSSSRGSWSSLDGRDGELEKIIEISSLEMNCQAEEVSRVILPRVCRVQA
jgi:hypothetical protein